MHCEIPPFETVFSHGPVLGSELTNTYKKTILIHMKTTLILDDELVAKAARLSGIDGKTALVHAGLRALVAAESARRLAALGGTEKDLRLVRRRRSLSPSNRHSS